METEYLKIEPPQDQTSFCTILSVLNRLFLLLAVALGAVSLSASPASAAYPPGGPVVTTLSSAYPSGGTVTAIASGFESCIGETVTFNISGPDGSRFAITSVIGPDGSATITFPAGVVGEWRIDAKTPSCRASSTSFSVFREKNDLPTGGSNTVPPIVSGGLLVVLGGLFLLVAKRRRDYDNQKEGAAS